MQQILFGHGRHGARLFGRVGDAFAHEENLPRQRVGWRRPRENGIDAVHAPYDLIRLLRARRRELAHDLLDAGGNRLRVGDDPRVRRARQQYRTLADAHRAFDLDRELAGRLPARAGNARAVLVDDVIARFLHVQRAFGLAHRVRIGLLVQTVRGD